MGLYQIEWKRSAVKELKKLDRQVIPSLLRIAEHLGEDPFPPGSRKIRGTRYTFRIRKGVYRIVYQVESNRLIITIVKVGHRKEVYEKLP